MIDHKLNFNDNTQAIFKKCQSRMYCMQKLRSMGVNSFILQNFYRCFIELILTFGFLIWYGGLSEQNKNVLKKMSKYVERLQALNKKALMLYINLEFWRKDRLSSKILCMCYISVLSFCLLGTAIGHFLEKKIRTRNTFVYKAIEHFNKSL